LTAQPLFSLHGRTPFKMVTGNTPDISEYLAFEWYQPVYYFDQTAFPEQREIKGRWIGVAHNVGQAMCFGVLPQSGMPIARTTVRAITEAELQMDRVRQELECFDASIKAKIGDHLIDESDLSFEVDSRELVMALQEASEEDDGHYKAMEPEADRPEIDDYDEEMYDKLLSAEVSLPRGDFQFIRRVIGRKRDAEGRPVGRSNTNPILDTRVYEVEFPDGTINEYAANILAEALYAQVDVDGNRYLLLKAIIDHKKDSTALSKNEYSTWNPHGSRNPLHKYTTKGWQLQCH